MSEAVQITAKQDAKAAQAALEILNEAWSYYTPEAQPAKDEAAPAEGYVDYYSDAA